MTVLSFNDLPTPGTNNNWWILDGYGGLNWSNFAYLNGITADIPSGYQNSIISPVNVAFNAWGGAASVSSDTVFSFNSAYFTAAWRDGLNILAEGYLDKNIIYSLDFIANTSGPILQVFNWSGVNKINFTTSNGIHHEGYGHNYAIFVMDEFNFEKG